MEKRWIWLAALVPALALAVLTWNHGPGLAAEDFAQYVLHARALLDGRSYGDTGYIHSRFAIFHGPSIMPPGVPLMILPVIAVFGENFTVLRLFMLLIGCVFFVTAGLYFARYDERRLGIGVAMLLGVSAPVVAFAPHIQSDLPFALFIWLALLLADKPGAWDWRRMALITLLGFMAMGTRELGIALLPAMLGVALVRRHELKWRALVPPGIWLMTIVAALLSGRVPRRAANLNWLLNPDALLWSLNQNINYRRGLGDMLLRPFPLGWQGPNDAWLVIAVILMLIGLVTWIRPASKRLSVWFALVYFSMLMVLPFFVGRYLWVLAPFFLFGLLRGIMLVVQRVPRLRMQPAAVALAFAAVWSLVGVRSVLGEPPPGSFRKHPDVQSLFAELRRLRAEGGPMRVAFARPRILALETGIPAAPLFRPANAIDMEIKRLCLTHVVTGSLGLVHLSDSAFHQVIRLRPTHFDSLWANPSFTVWRYTALPRDKCPN